MIFIADMHNKNNEPANSLLYCIQHKYNDFRFILSSDNIDQIYLDATSENITTDQLDGIRLYAEAFIKGFTSGLEIKK